jgi:hypothetical protein
VQGAFSPQELIGLYLHDVIEAFDFQMLERLLVAADCSIVCRTAFRFLRLCLERLSPELAVRQFECAMDANMLGCIRHALATHCDCSHTTAETLTLLRCFVESPFNPGADARAVEAGLSNVVCSILNTRWDYSVPYRSTEVFDNASEEDVFVQGFLVLVRTILVCQIPGAHSALPAYVADLAADVLRTCFLAAAWLATMPPEHVTARGRKRWLLLDFAGVMLTMLSRDGNTAHELMLFFTAHIDDALLTRWTLVYGLTQIVTFESQCIAPSRDPYCLASDFHVGWQDGQSLGAPRALATLVSFPGALECFGTALQRYPSCRSPAGFLLAMLVQNNTSSRAILRASPEFDVLYAALTATVDALGRSHGFGAPLQIPDINLRAPEGSDEAEVAQGHSLYAVAIAAVMFERPAETEDESWARRVAAADAAAAALLAEEEAAAAPKGAAAAAAASGKKKKAGSSARRRAKAAAAASSDAAADTEAALAGLGLNDDPPPAHEDDALCIVCLDAPRDTALACCGAAHPPLLCADCAAALLARANGGPAACPVRCCTPQP